MTTGDMCNIPPISIGIISSRTVLSENKRFEMKRMAIEGFYLGLIDSFNRRDAFREGCGLAVVIVG